MCMSARCVSIWVTLRLTGASEARVREVVMSWTEFLEETNQKKVEQLQDGLPDDVWVRFWDEKTVQLDGDFNLSNLKCLVAMMESFESNDGD